MYCSITSNPSPPDGFFRYDSEIGQSTRLSSVRRAPPHVIAARYRRNGSTLLTMEVDAATPMGGATGRSSPSASDDMPSPQTRQATLTRLVEESLPFAVKRLRRLRDRGLDGTYATASTIDGVDRNLDEHLTTLVELIDNIDVTCPITDRSLYSPATTQRK
ncbi:hypothetical protein THAOC_29719 [Thalassiosira oceanica]|uniref:Uncharacterized protein n=1 Tax=Thalassiosira oceanica TaxID=159749 RepID=K0RFV1_THAOC|nr:hypothetical protein THAOC_29719 [Thalassiosira oceanica]|eukprot:EJK51139.1 hypothetical protein THAOC_29719 [Thalassiosira oceanica]